MPDGEVETVQDLTSTKSLTQRTAGSSPTFIERLLHQFHEELRVFLDVRL